VFGKTPLVDRALDDCLTFRFFEREERKRRNNALRESPGAAAIDRRCQFSNSFSLLLFPPFVHVVVVVVVVVAVAVAVVVVSCLRSYALAVIPLLFVHPSRDSPRERGPACVGPSSARRFARGRPRGEEYGICEGPTSRGE